MGKESKQGQGHDDPPVSVPSQSTGSTKNRICFNNLVFHLVRSFAVVDLLLLILFDFYFKVSLVALADLELAM